MLGVCTESADGRGAACTHGYRRAREARGAHGSRRVADAARLARARERGDGRALPWRQRLEKAMEGHERGYNWGGRAPAAACPPIPRAARAAGAPVGRGREPDAASGVRRAATDADDVRFRRTRRAPGDFDRRLCTTHLRGTNIHNLNSLCLYYTHAIANTPRTTTKRTPLRNPTGVRPFRDARPPLEFRSTAAARERLAGNNHACSNALPRSNRGCRPWQPHSESPSVQRCQAGTLVQVHTQCYEQYVRFSACSRAVREVTRLE